MPLADQRNEREFKTTELSGVEGARRVERHGESVDPARRIPPPAPLHQTLRVPSTAADGGASHGFTNGENAGSLLYTADQRRRRDASPWTLVQGILAPVQFAIFLMSLGLVVRYLVTSEGYGLATLSITAKTVALYAIMVTGAIWEREVFGCYLFARAFFWEDVFSMLVLTLHTLYLVALATDGLAPRALMVLALAAYATYVVNAGQFILKLRAARLQRAPASGETLVGVAS